MSKVMAICNQKGGVGKTVTTVNLGVGLARKGKRVLLVDVDAQGSLTASLGYQHPDQLDETLATVLGKVIGDKPLASGEGIIHQKEGLDLLPANIDLAAMEVTLVNIMSRETILQEYLNTVRDQYDVILLDCCPSLGMLTINALSAANEVRIPSLVIERHGTAHGNNRESETADQPHSHNQRHFNHHGFKIDLHIKDLNNALDCAHAVGAPVPMTAQVQEVFQWMHSRQGGQKDHSAIAQYYQHLAEIELGR